MSKYVIICLREKDGKDIPIPIMASDGEGDPTETMAIWEEYEEAVEFCYQHILCKSSLNIIVDLTTGDGIIK
jgi:hypothetical protein